MEKNKGLNILLRIVKTIALPAVIYVIFTVCAPGRFGTWTSMSILFQNSIIPCIIGYAMSFGHVARIRDFSIGARLLFGGLIGGLLGSYFGMAGMIIGCVAAAVLTGVISGIVFRIANIPSMILSFGLAMVFEVLGTYAAGTQGMIRLDAGMSIFGRAPWNFVVFAIAFALFFFLYYRTKFSYNVRAVGSDPRIARNMGIKIMNVKFWTYVIGSVLLGIASLVQLGYAGTMGAASGMTTLGIVFRPMMAVMIGVVLESVVILPIGIYIGALSINMLFSGIIALGWPDPLQNVMLGFFMIVVMGVTTNRNKIAKAFSRKKSAEETVEAAS